MVKFNVLKVPACSPTNFPSENLEIIIYNLVISYKLENFLKFDQEKLGKVKKFHLFFRPHSGSWDFTARVDSIRSQHQAIGPAKITSTVVQIPSE